MACSRPTSEVVPTGSRREPGAAAWLTPRERAANRSLSSVARSSRTSRPSSAGVRKLRYEASVRMRASSSARRGSRSRRGRLDIQQPRQRLGRQLELVLQPRDLHRPYSPPNLSLPIHPRDPPPRTAPRTAHHPPPPAPVRITTPSANPHSPTAPGHPITEVSRQLARPAIPPDRSPSPNAIKVQGPFEHLHPNYEFESRRQL